MTIQATPGHRDVRTAETTAGAPGSKTRNVALVGAGTGSLMALLTQEGTTHLQEVGGYGAVGIMAIGAVLRHRLVVPEERSPLFRVALVAGIIDGIALQIRAPRRAVRVMAIRACDFALEDRMARRLVNLSPLFLVTREADSGLGFFIPYPVVAVVMNLVA